MKLIAGPHVDQYVSRWVADRIGAEDLSPCTAIGVVDRNDDLVGGVVFHQYSRENRTIHLSAAGSTARWLNRNVLYGIFSYPFSQLGVERITCLTGKKNRSARQFLEGFGFKLEGCIRRGLADQDLMIYGLLNREWQDHKLNAEKGRIATSSTRSGATRQCSVQREHANGSGATAAEHGEHTGS